jgi:hypothetical protein
MRHEGLVALFRNCPALVAELLGGLGRAVPRHAHARPRDAELPRTLATARRGDVAIELVNAQGRPVLGAVVEVQLRSRREKRWVWPLYLAALHAELECPVALLVVTPSRSVARWAARAIDTFQPGSRFVPIVIGPERIPCITDPESAARVPEAAVLSAMAHGKGPKGVEVALAALTAVAPLDAQRASFYHDLVLQELDEAARRALETEMDLRDYQFQTAFARKHRAEGEAKGKTEAILVVLLERGLDPTDDERARIVTCRDMEQLERWLRRAVHVGSVTELLTS